MEARIDTSVLRGKLAGLEQRADAAAAAVLLSGADTFVGFMDKFARRDTGRYVRGWIEAGNDLPIPQRRPPALKASRWEQKIRGALESQIDRLVKQINSLHGILDAWYYSKGRPLNAWARGKQAEVNRLTRRLERAVGQYREYLGADGPVIAFDVFSQGRTKITREGVRKRLRLTTVRTKIYGGEGTLRAGPDGPSVILHNREPHASLVERRYRFVARARGMVRALTEAEGRRIATRHLKSG